MRTAFDDGIVHDHQVHDHRLVSNDSTPEAHPHGQVLVLGEYSLDGRVDVVVLEREEEA
jgi:hypothetical protein